MERFQDHTTEPARTARVLLAAGTRPAPPRERPPSWSRREPSRPASALANDALDNASVEAYYRGPSLRHAPSFY